MLLCRITRKTDRGGCRISSPFYPGPMRIAMGHHTGEPKTGGSVTGGEGSASLPELAGAAALERPLTVHASLHRPGHGGGSSSRLQREQSSLARAFFALEATQSISQSGGSKLKPYADV